MIMNELNTNLIEAAKEKFPAKGQLANILMDTLYMGKEAISVSYTHLTLPTICSV